MPNIAINDLHSTGKMSDSHPNGSELFSDSESYMNELTDGEMNIVSGGSTPSFVASIITRITARSSMRCLQASIRITQKPVTRNTPVSIL